MRHTIVTSRVCVHKVALLIHKSNDVMTEFSSAFRTVKTCFVKYFIISCYLDLDDNKTIKT